MPRSLFSSDDPEIIDGHFGRYTEGRKACICTQTSYIIMLARQREHICHHYDSLSVSDRLETHFLCYHHLLFCACCCISASICVCVCVCVYTSLNTSVNVLIYIKRYYTAFSDVCNT